MDEAYARLCGPMCQTRYACTDFVGSSVGKAFLSASKDIEIIWDDRPPAHATPVYLLLCRSLAAAGMPVKASDELPALMYGAGEYECLILLPPESGDEHFKWIGYLIARPLGLPKRQALSPPSMRREVLRVCRLLYKQFAARDVPESCYENIDNLSICTIMVA